MLSRMSPKYYLSDEVFERERHKIFRKLWLFVGLRQLVTEHNSFITRNLAGVPIVIQNFEGKLRAFENVCLHRSAKLQWEPVGKRPLLCRYHGWGYGASGKVENIPFEKELYRFDPEERESLKLREFSLETIGNAIFVNLCPNPLPITDQFDQTFIYSLQASSEAYDGEVMVTTWHCRFNWKLAYENLRDANHPRFVHPQSLAKYVPFTPAVDEPLDAFATPALNASSPEKMRELLRRFSYGGPEVHIPDMPHFSWHGMVERYGELDSYYNWLAYPNLHIASGNGGFSFTLEHHIPISPQRTDIEIYWLTSRKRHSYPHSSNVLLSQMHGSKLVVGEDVRVMEMVQEALHDAAPQPHQGVYEGLNKQVERWYVRLMESTDEI